MSHTDPEARARYWKQWSENNRERIKTNRRKYIESGRNALRQRTIFYGITPQQYDELLIKQDYLCAVCGSDLGDKRPCVDHDHVTGKVRGIVHRECNTLLGMAKDSLEILERAIAYLGRNRGSQVSIPKGDTESQDK